MVSVGSGHLISSMMTVVNNIVYLKVAKRVDLKSSHHANRQKLVTIWWGGGCVNDPSVVIILHHTHRSSHCIP